MSEEKNDSAADNREAFSPRRSRPQQHQANPQHHQNYNQRPPNERSMMGNMQNPNHMSHQNQATTPAGYINENIPPMNLSELKALKVAHLHERAQTVGIDISGNLRKQDIIFELLRAQTQQQGAIYGEGVLEVFPEGYGFLREPAYNYEASPDDIYVAPSIIRGYGLRVGDTVSGLIRSPNEKERYYPIMKVQRINGLSPADHKNIIPFENLTPLFPQERFRMETKANNYSTRIIDMLCPIGKGQRALIVAPPRAGKTVLMQDIANAITQNHPEVTLIVLLIDERPEEVTDMQRNIRGEVVSSTFDEQPTRHVQIADLVIEKAKRLVEQKRDVVILLDSITRLGRAYNAVMPASGKILSGGVDANALHKPKRFFGAARNIEEGGSLTIIATALIDTGSRMDEVIFEEFKGTGNSEIVLDRTLMEKRIFPCLNINKSGTRKDDQLLSGDIANRVWILRQLLHPLNVIDSMELLLSRMKGSKSNADFFDSMNT